MSFVKLLYHLIHTALVTKGRMTWQLPQISHEIRCLPHAKIFMKHNECQDDENFIKVSLYSTSQQWSVAWDETRERLGRKYCSTYLYFGGSGSRVMIFAGPLFVHPSSRRKHAVACFISHFRLLTFLTLTVKIYSYI